MAIILAAYLTVKGRFAMPPQTIKKWTNDTDFGFNIGDPESWRKYLSSYRHEGKLLPRKDEHGSDIVYRVYNWGGITGIARAEPGRVVSYFPGVDANGKTLDIVKHGKLLPAR